MTSCAGSASGPASPSVFAHALPLTKGGMALWASYRNQHFSRHAHEGYALGVIEEGALAFRYCGANLVAPPGSINLVQPDVPHDGKPAKPGGWRYRMLYLPIQVLLLVLPPGSPPPFFRAGVLNDAPLAAEILRTHRTLMDPQTNLFARQTLLLKLLSDWITRHADARPVLPESGHEPRAVRLALEWLDAHFSENPSLETLSQVVGLSPWHLVRVITTHTGLPPHAHLLKRRLRSVKAALAGPARLADIAAEVGFADQSHLTRAFKARFGLTPGAYRKIVQNRFIAAD